VADVPATAVSNFLAVLRTLPVWLLAGLAFAGYAVIFIPGFGGIDPKGFRTEWGVWVWIEAISFSVLTVTRAIDSGISAYIERQRNRVLRRPLRLVPRHLQCWWHLAKQRDNSFVSQISLEVEVTNPTDRPARIVKVRLIRPRAKGELLHADAILPKADSPYHSNKHAVPPHDTVTASVHIMVRGAIGRQGHPIRATLGIMDQYGEEYRLKGISLPTHDARLPARALAAQMMAALRALPGLRSPITPPAETLQSSRPEWNHQGKFDEVDLILNEEMRNYAARGRDRGGLGSLNVGLQSEPNSGWTTVGTAPSLLWDKANAKPIGSPNIARLVSVHAALGNSEKRDLEEYLLSHLNKTSSYANVSYFIFLALYRMGRAIDALRAARSWLAGDKDYAYSNLLGTLSALVSREHFDIDPALYPQILETLAGDTEHNFRLNEKINLARLEHLDSRLTADSAAQMPRSPIPPSELVDATKATTELNAGRGTVQLPDDRTSGDIRNIDK
jgi:hypothetical protein